MLGDSYFHHIDPRLYSFVRAGNQQVCYGWSRPRCAVAERRERWVWNVKHALFESLVYAQQGVMTEVYYPRLDVPNVQTLQFIFVEADGHHVETEAEDTTHRLRCSIRRARLPSNKHCQKRTYTITKTYIADPDRSLF